MEDKDFTEENYRRIGACLIALSILAYDLDGLREKLTENLAEGLNLSAKDIVNAAIDILANAGDSDVK